MSFERNMDLQGFQTFKEQFLDNLLGEEPSIQLRLWQQNGTLKKFFSELNKCAYVEQDPAFHPDTVFEHLIKTCDSIAPTSVLRWAALLHDIGKASTRKEVIYCQKDLPNKAAHIICPVSQKLCSMECSEAQSKITFYYHAAVGTRIGQRVLRFFKIGGKQTRKILHLITNHMYYFVPEWTDGAIQRFINRTKITKEDLQNSNKYPLFCLRAADRMSRGLNPVSERQLNFEKRLLEYFERQNT